LRATYELRSRFLFPREPLSASLMKAESSVRNHQSPQIPASNLDIVVVDELRERARFITSG
jgi:hypothetical protein